MSGSYRFALSNEASVPKAIELSTFDLGYVVDMPCSELLSNIKIVRRGEIRSI